MKIRSFILLQDGCVDFFCIDDNNHNAETVTLLFSGVSLSYHNFCFYQQKQLYY